MAIAIKYNPKKTETKTEEGSEKIIKKESEKLSYYKSYLLSLEEFKHDADLVNILLDDKGTYTKEEVRSLLQEFKKKMVM